MNLPGSDKRELGAREIVDFFRGAIGCPCPAAFPDLEDGIIVQGDPFGEKSCKLGSRRCHGSTYPFHLPAAVGFPKLLCT